MTGPLFLSLDSARIAREISGAERSVCYAAPGILKEPAEALAAVARAIGPELITVCLDFDERVMRMGFGTLDAVTTLRDAGIEVRSTPGLRTGLVIIDDAGYIFTPTALYLEAEERSDAAPNTARLSSDQVTEALARLSPRREGHRHCIRHDRGGAREDSRGGGRSALGQVSVVREFETNGGLI